MSDEKPSVTATTHSTVDASGATHHHTTNVHVPHHKLRWTDVVGTVALVGALFFAGKQMIDFSESLDKMQESVNAANALAEAAQDQVKAGNLMAEQAKRQADALFEARRAWLIGGDFATTTPVAGQTQELSFQLRNAGLSPAFNVRANFKWQYVKPPEPLTAASVLAADLTDKGASCKDASNDPTRNIQFPTSGNQQLRTYRQFIDNMPPLVASRILNGEIMLVLNTCAKYTLTRDAQIGGPEEHTTRMCGYHMPEPGTPFNQWSWVACGNGNDAD